jgi:hypothetical protein
MYTSKLIILNPIEIKRRIHASFEFSYLDLPPPLATLPYEHCNKLFLKTMNAVIEFRILGHEEQTKI